MVLVVALYLVKTANAEVQLADSLFFESFKEEHGVSQRQKVLFLLLCLEACNQS